jgi:hypothetical protein
VLSDGHPSDWRDAAAYASLLEADRSIFAWEWLRRDPGYREAFHRWVGLEAAREPGAEAATWGLHAFERPDLAAPQARPVWRAEVHPHVLSAVAGETAEAHDAFELGRCAGLATTVGGSGERQHLLLSDGLRAIRLDILTGSVTAGALANRLVRALPPSSRAACEALGADAARLGRSRSWSRPAGNRRGAAERKGWRAALA